MPLETPSQGDVIANFIYEDFPGFLDVVHDRGSRTRAGILL